MLMASCVQLSVCLSVCLLCALCVYVCVCSVLSLSMCVVSVCSVLSLSLYVCHVCPCVSDTHRKVCKNCLCPREDHDITEDTAGGLAGRVSVGKILFSPDVETMTRRNSEGPGSPTYVQC